MAQIKAERHFKKYSYTFIIAADGTSKEAIIDPNLGIKGEALKIIVVIPDWTNTVTTIISCINADTKEIFASSSLAKNNEYDITLKHNECIIMGDTGEKWKVTLSGVPGGTGGTITLVVYLEG